jgi:solute carrier family 13 (sodium-dependent dicarboxylate transporter), member 2/3/5
MIEGGRQLVQDTGQASTAQQIRRFATALLAFSIPVAVSWLPIEVTGLDPWGLRVLSVVVAGLILWISEVMPIGITSIAVVVMLAMAAPGESGEATRAALAGFENPAPYFMLGSLTLGAATVKTGLAQRFARLLVRGARGSGRRLYGQMVAMMPVMAILVPSALTRSAMLIPAYEQIFRSHRIERGHPLPRLIMLATATLQIQASTAVLTGGAVPVIAGSLLGGLSWARWFALMAIPNYAVLFLFAAVLFLLYRPGPMPAPVTADPEPEVPSVTPPSTRVTSAEWRALAIIGTTTLLWLTDGIHHLNPAIPALIGATALFLPWIGVMVWDDFEEAAPWSIFLVTGSSLSLAIALDRSGAAAWIASTILSEIPLETLPLVPLLLSFIGMVGVVNIILPNRVAVLGITIPLVMSLAVSLDLNPFTVGMIVPIVAQTTVYYPVQLATALVTFRTRHYSKGELFRAGVLLSIVSVTVIFVVAIPWWALLGEPIRV